MPTNPRKLGGLNSSKGSHAAKTGSSSISTQLSTKQVETKPSQTLDPTSMPAVKGLARYQSRTGQAIKESFKPRLRTISSQTTRAHSATATTRPPTLAGVSSTSSTRDSSHIQIPKRLTQETKASIPKAKNASTAPTNNDQTRHNGRQDPYHIPSDSEDDGTRGRKRTSVADKRVVAAPPEKKRAGGANTETSRLSGLSSSLAEVTTDPLVPNVLSHRTRVPEGGRRSRSRNLAPNPRSANLITLDSSSDEQSSRPTSTSKHRSNPRHSLSPQLLDSSAVITVDDSSSDGIESSPIKRRLPCRITKGSSASSSKTSPSNPRCTRVTISTGFVSQHRGEDSEQVSTPVDPTAKAIGKRSSHSINSHLKIIDKKPENAMQAIMLPNSANKQSKASIARYPTRGSLQTGTAGSKEADRRTIVSETPSSQRVVIDDVKKTMKVKFGKKAIDKPIPESFFREPESSDDEYKPSSNEDRSSEGQGQDCDLPSFGGSTVIKSSPLEKDINSSQVNTRRLRSGSHPKPLVSFMPVNTLVPIAQEQVSSHNLQTAPPKFGRGYSKRVRDAFSNTSSSNKSGDEESEKVDSNITLPPIQDSGSDSRKTVTTKLNEATEKRQWSPLSWMEKYETEFMPGMDGNVWLATGPFKGWILDGPGAGKYIPGCKEPDDRTITEAEKTAEIRWNLRWGDSEAHYASDTEESDEVHDEQTMSDIRDAGLTHFQSPVGNSKEMPLPETILPIISPNVSETANPQVNIDDKTVERAARTERTKQYVLSGGSSNDLKFHESAGIPSPISSRTRRKFPARFAPTAPPEDAPSPPSAESETTSTLITQQLINDCAPPSNQELAELMSSSPAIRHASTPSLIHQADGSADSSSSESSSGIPAHISPKPPTRSLEVVRTQEVSFGPEHVDAAHILGGIAGRRTTRSLTNHFPSTTKSNQVPRDVKRGSTAIRLESSNRSQKDSPKAHIVVEVPGLPTEEQDEYEVVSLNPEIRSTLSPKSFKEINEATSKGDIKSNDPDEEQTLDYVLRQSPRWLAGITEAKEADVIAAKVPKSSHGAVDVPRAQKPPKDAEPASPDSDDEVCSESRLTTSRTSINIPDHKLDNVGCHNTGSSQKRRASALEPLVAGEAHTNKKQKMDDDQSHVQIEDHSKAIGLTRNQKNRLRKKRLKQQKHTPGQQNAGHAVGNNVGRSAKSNSQSTMTPPTSRPTSSEA
ncbi:hypothetical protein F5B19DRAFT_477910 [Rostrohypoxylon terebratum]|nr:hypothetical protein F5B19DRAFT_477910 [Rostrohypoxylon terebratum]